MRQIASAFASPGGVQGWDDRIYSGRPEIVMTVRIVPREEEEEETEIAFKAPQFTRAEAEVGQVRLAWQDAGENNVETAGYHLYRRRGEGGAFTRVTGEPVKEKAFVDAAVEPEVAYAYAVSAVTDDARVTGGESARSEPREVRTLATLRLELKKVSMVVEGAPVAQVRVHRFHEGRWWEKDYMVLEGSPLGRVERLWRDGRVVEVDFRTGATVKTISQYKGKRMIANQAFDVFLGKLTYSDAEGVSELREE
jgi:hypothetical protein